MTKEYMDNIRRVAVIGAGISGLQAARYLQQELSDKLECLRVFEQKTSFGGVWRHTAKTTRPDFSSKHHQQQEAAIVASDTKPPPASPAYTNLRTHIPARMMALPGRPFPKHVQDHPHHTDILRYWEQFVDDHQLAQYLQLSTQVTLVLPHTNDDGWQLHLQRLDDDTGLPAGGQWTEEFDAVIVANGHFYVPYLPTTMPGLADLADRAPDRVQHVSEYRRPEAYQGKHVMLVGNGLSAVNIVDDLRPWTTHVSRSIRDTERIDELAQLTNTQLIPEIIRIHHGQSAVLDALPIHPGAYGATDEAAKPPVDQVWLELTDGTRYPAPDTLILATGYRFSMPFLSWLYPDAQQALPDGVGQGADWPPILSDDHIHCCHLYHHIYYTPRPTLAIIGLLLEASSFIAAERQAWHIASVLAGRCALPPVAERAKSARADELAGAGISRGIHTMLGDTLYDYYDTLAREVLEDPLYAADSPTRSDDFHPGYTPDWWKEVRNHADQERRRRFGL